MEECAEARRGSPVALCGISSVEQRLSRAATPTIQSNESPYLTNSGGTKKKLTTSEGGPEHDAHRPMHLTIQPVVWEPWEPATSRVNRFPPAFGVCFILVSTWRGYLWKCCESFGAGLIATGLKCQGMMSCKSVRESRVRRSIAPQGIRRDEKKDLESSEPS